MEEEPEIKDNVIDINVNKPHITGELICLRCAHRAFHTWPAEVPLKILYCPDCHEFGYLICTGQVLEEWLHGTFPGQPKKVENVENKNVTLGKIIDFPGKIV